MGSIPTQWDEEYELVVLGAGAGGLTAALVSSIEGLRTLLIEKSDQVGGTTAFSSGTVWIPDNAQQRQLGATNDAAAALEYLDALVGEHQALSGYGHATGGNRWISGGGITE